MAAKSILAMATVALAMVSTNQMSAEVITAIAGKYGMDTNTIASMADECLTAKAAAEQDMLSAN